MEDKAQVSVLPARRKGHDAHLRFSSPKDTTRTKYANYSGTQTDIEIIICETHHKCLYIKIH